MWSVALDTTLALSSGVVITKIRWVIHLCCFCVVSSLHTLSILVLFQDIAVTRGAGAVVDYSVLYDNIVRATLWKEVSLVYIPKDHLLYYVNFVGYLSHLLAIQSFQWVYSGRQGERVVHPEMGDSWRPQLW